MLETLDYTIRIGSTQTFLYFDLYLYSAYAAHYVYNYKKYPLMVKSSLQLTKQPPTFWFMQAKSSKLNYSKIQIFK